jgi:hypothetical protein
MNTTEKVRSCERSHVTTKVVTDKARVYPGSATSWCRRRGIPTI